MIVVLFYQFSSGYWIFGFSVPQVTAIAIDSNGQCVKWEGEQRECTIDERYMMNNLYKLYTSDDF